MAPPAHVADDTVIPRTTLPRMFLEAVDRHGGAAAYGRIKTSMEIEEISYDEILESVRVVAGGLAARGLARGDVAAIMSHNRLEWVLADYGCLCSGIVDVPVYPSLKPPQIAYILRDCGARIVFVPDAEHLEKAVDARARCDHGFEIVVFDPPPQLQEGVTSWEAFMAEGARRAGTLSLEAFRAEAWKAEPEDVATVLYTSGTTGDPKGVMLTHRNVTSNVLAAGMVLRIEPGDTTVSFLPLTHIFQRTVDYVFVASGATVYHGRTMLTAMEDMRRVRPTVVAAVPRIYEKMYQAIVSTEGLRKALVTWALSVADRAADARLEGRHPRGLLALSWAVADRVLFRKIRAAVGGRIRFMVSGSAPLSPSLTRFFASIGVRIMEGYGLTETSPVITINTESDFRAGTVGQPIPGTEVRIAQDGEILVRGPQVMKGYHNRPQDTAEALDADGWFHTGDVGEFDEDRFLRITDRKKDLIVTAGGKNVAPALIEGRLKSCPVVEQSVMVGDRRRFVALLVVPAFPRLEAWARAQKIPWGSHAELVRDPRVRSWVEGEVRKHFDGLASYETPKKIALLEEDFTIANGFLTPSLKVKRKVVQERFQELIDGLYAGAPGEAHAHEA
jgi:long-chain acyl-CoA synthetase